MPASRAQFCALLDQRASTDGRASSVCPRTVTRESVGIGLSLEMIENNQGGTLEDKVRPLPQHRAHNDSVSAVKVSQDADLPGFL